ncbi:MAG: cupin domain-containing protein [Nitriliruptoraceae bacterium]
MSLESVEMATDRDDPSSCDPIGSDPIGSDGQERQVDLPRPSVVALDSVPVIPADQAPTRMRLARLITQEEHGSDLLVGASWSEPGERSNTWSARADDHLPAAADAHYGKVEEIYYVIHGRFRLTWQADEVADEHDGALEFGPDDAVHLPAGRRYQLENIGDVPGLLIYVMTPPPH